MLTDFHSHILPGVDDGSKSVEQSLEMLRMEAAQGIRRVIATPHFYPRHDSPERFLRRRAEALNRLQEAMEIEEGLPQIELAAEIYFFSGISDSEVLSQLTIGQKRCILLEMPHSPWTDSMYRELEGICVKQGLTPVIAHVDRYIRPFKSYGIPERLKELPVMVQANAEFFLSGSTRRMALRMLKKGQIHVLGSDCHNLKDRKPNLGDAVRLIQERLGPEHLDWIRTHEQEILCE